MRTKKTASEKKMILQQHLVLLNSFQPGNYDLIIQQEIKDNKEVYFLSFVDLEETQREILFSKNGLRREFKSLNTLKKYVMEKCSNVRKITILIEKNQQMQYLEDIEFKFTNKE